MVIRSSLEVDPAKESGFGLYGLMWVNLKKLKNNSCEYMLYML